MTPPIIFDTSRAKLHDKCPRARWWNYEYLPPGASPTSVRGVVRRALSIPLTVGIYTHEGIATLLTTSDVESAVGAALHGYRTEVAARGIDAELEADVAYTVNEQAALIEALIRAWARVRWQRWLDEYEFLEVERENHSVLDAADPTVEFQARSDALVRRKSDEALFIVNFKTVSNADERWLRSWEYDVQTMSEVVAAEARLGTRLAGVIIEGLIKSARYPDKNRETGEVLRYRNRTPLLYGYVRRGNPPLSETEYGWEYTRAKGWGRFNVWEEQFAPVLYEPEPQEGHLVVESGVKHWVEHVLPAEVVEAQFITVPPIVRSEGMIRDWCEQQVTRERRARSSRDLIEGMVTGATGSNPYAINENDLRKALNESFGQSFNSCCWPTPCPYIPLCFDIGGSIKADPVGSGLYVRREPHHEREREVCDGSDR